MLTICLKNRRSRFGTGGKLVSSVVKLLEVTLQQAFQSLAVAGLVLKQSQKTYEIQGFFNFRKINPT